MALSFSKSFGKSRITLSKNGVYGSMGLGGGFRVGTRLGGGSSRTSKKIQEHQVDNTPASDLFSLKDIGTWLTIIVVCGLPIILGYMFLWTWLANFVAWTCGAAALGVLISAAIGDHKRSKTVDNLDN